MRAHFDRWLRWSTISSFMRLRISQFAAAIPVIGYLLIWSAPLQHFLESHPTLKSVEFLSVLGRLKLIYVGSISLALAWVLYLVFCPKVVKRHPAVEDYMREVASIGDFFYVRRRNEFVRTFVQRASVNVDPAFTPAAPRTVREEFRPVQIFDAVNSEGNEDYHPTILRAFYLSEEVRNPLALMLCAIFICVGLLLLAIPSVETFVLVLWKLLLPSVGIG